MLLVDLGATPLETSISGNAVDHPVMAALAVALALELALPHLALALRKIKILKYTVIHVQQLRSAHCELKGL
jgi:hypothetical protein